MGVDRAVEDLDSHIGGCQPVEGDGRAHGASFAGATRRDLRVEADDGDVGPRREDLLLPRRELLGVTAPPASSTAAPAAAGSYSSVT